MEGRGNHSCGPVAAAMHAPHSMECDGEHDLLRVPAPSARPLATEAARSPRVCQTSRQADRHHARSAGAGRRLGEEAAVNLEFTARAGEPRTKSAGIRRPDLPTMTFQPAFVVAATWVSERFAEALPAHAGRESITHFVYM